MRKLLMIFARSIVKAVDEKLFSPNSEVKRSTLFRWDEKEEEGGVSHCCCFLFVIERSTIASGFHVASQLRINRPLVGRACGAGQGNCQSKHVDTQPS